MTRGLAVDGRDLDFLRNQVADFEAGAAAWNFGAGVNNWQRVTSGSAWSGAWVGEAAGNLNIRDLVSATPVPGRPGDVFYAEGWFRRIGVASTGEVNLAATVDRTTGGPTYPAFGSFGSRADLIPETWTKLSGTIVLPANATRIICRPSVRNNVSAGVFQVDGVVMRRIRRGLP